MKTKKVSRSPITCSAAELVATRFRQIHLDFHTSELIPGIGAARVEKYGAAFLAVLKGKAVPS